MINALVSLLSSALLALPFCSASDVFLPVLNSKGDVAYRIFWDDDRWFLLNDCDKNVVISGTTQDYPYSFSEKKRYYIPFAPDCFFESDDVYFWAAKNPDAKVLLSRIGSGVSNFSYSLFSLDELMSSSVKKIPNYLYFMLLGNNHCYNGSNHCAVIASEILRGYYDTFLSDDFIAEKYDKISILDGAFSSWSSTIQTPGTGKSNDDISHLSDQRILDEELAYTRANINAAIDTTGLLPSAQKAVLEHYLQEQNISYSLNYCEGNLWDCLTQQAKATIKNAIDAGRPVMATGGYHTAVAFAYSDDYVYVHVGNGQTGRVNWSVYTNWDLTFWPSAIDLVPLGSHSSHGNNFYSKQAKKFYCFEGYSRAGGMVALDEIGLPTSYSTSLCQSSGSMPGATFGLTSQCSFLTGANSIMIENISQLAYLDFTFSRLTSSVFLSLIQSAPLGCLLFALKPIQLMEIFSIRLSLEILPI